MTNGVSFELTTGSFYNVWFTNGWRLDGGYSDPGAWTLNVNSTGAKQVQYAQLKSNGYGKDTGWSNSITSGRYVPTCRLMSFIYTGTYHFAMNGLFDLYSDYGD